MLFNFTCQQPNEIDIIIPNLQVRKLKLRKAKELFKVSLGKSGRARVNLILLRST